VFKEAIGEVAQPGFQKAFNQFRLVVCLGMIWNSNLASYHVSGIIPAKSFYWRLDRNRKGLILASHVVSPYQASSIHEEPKVKSHRSYQSMKYHARGKYPDQQDKCVWSYWTKIEVSLLVLYSWLSVCILWIDWNIISFNSVKVLSSYIYTL